MKRASWWTIAFLAIALFAIWWILTHPNIKL